LKDGIIGLAIPGSLFNMKSFYEYRREDLKDILMVTNDREKHPLASERSYKDWLGTFNSLWAHRSYYERTRKLSGKKTIHDIRSRFEWKIIFDEVRAWKSDYFNN